MLTLRGIEGSFYPGKMMLGEVFQNTLIKMGRKTIGKTIGKTL